MIRYAEIGLDQRISLTDARNYLIGKGGNRPAVETIRVWIIRGVMANGACVKLMAEKKSGAWLTTRRWIEEFEEARAETIERKEAAGCKMPATPPLTPKTGKTRTKIADYRAAKAYWKAQGVITE